MDYQFRAAEPEDVDDIIGIIQERIDWMDEKNLYQWNRTNYMQRYPREYFLGRIASHEFYLAVDPEGKTVGVMALLLEDGRWTEDEKKNCYYVHHLATRPQAKGAGKALLSFCEDLSLQEGKKVVRLDCQKGNDRLNAFYQSLGYQVVGPMVEGAYEGIKREKKLKE